MATDKEQNAAEVVETAEKATEAPKETKKETKKAKPAKATSKKADKEVGTFAIIETGGKQYKVQAGTIIDVEKLDGDAKSTINFDKILLYTDGSDVKIGTPYLEGASVKATVLNHVKDDKKVVFKFKSKTGYRKKQGHRQNHTTVRVEAISAK